MVKLFEFQDLIGAEVSGVAFIRDYVEFHFDGPILRVLADPTFVAGGNRWNFPHPGSRDALCSVIGRVVQRAEDEEDQLVLGFGDFGDVVILKESSVAGVEIAQLVPVKDGKFDVAGMLIWENMLSS